MLSAMTSLSFEVIYQSPARRIFALYNIRMREYCRSVAIRKLDAMDAGNFPKLKSSGCSGFVYSS